MKDYVPLIQTVLWILLALVIVRILRPDLAALRRALMERIESGSALKVGPVELGELKSEINAVRNQVNDLGEQVSNLFLLTMSTPMYENLRKLASGKFGRYEKSGGLMRELRHLRDLGYIDCPSITNIPDIGHELLDHLSVTSTGHRFVELRESIRGQY